MTSKKSEDVSNEPSGNGSTTNNITAPVMTSTTAITSGPAPASSVAQGSPANTTSAASTTVIGSNSSPVHSPPSSPAPPSTSTSNPTSTSYPNHSPLSPAYRKTTTTVVTSSDDMNMNISVVPPSTTTSAATATSIATNTSAPSTGPSTRTSTSISTTNLPSVPMLEPGTPTDASSSIAASSTTDAGVVLGVRALELQQEEFERRRAATITISNKKGKDSSSSTTTPSKQIHSSSVPRSNPFDDTPPHVQYHPYGIRGQQPMTHRQDLSSLGSSVGNSYMMPHNSEGVPTTVHLTNMMQDEDSATERGSSASATTGGGVIKRLTRANSIGKFLRTPLKHTEKIRKSLTERFDKDRFDKEPGPSTNAKANWNDRNDDNDPQQKGAQQQGQLDSSTQQPNGEKAQHKQALIYGYLFKLGRHGKWQRRWFETDGEVLTYYKSRKRTKPLATLDLSRVGTISTDPSDPAGCTFSIEVASRLYFLSADRQDVALDWVISLNRVKEARMQIGGLKLVDSQAGMGTSKIVVDSRDGENDEDTRWRSESDEAQARVVMTMSRQRTKGYGRDEFADDLQNILKTEDTTTATREANATGTASVPTTISPISKDTSLIESFQSNVVRSINKTGGVGFSGHTLFDNFTTIRTSTPSSQHPQTRHSVPQQPHPIRNPVMVRWNKQRSSLQNWSRRLSRWAKRMTLLRCVVQNDTVHLQHSGTDTNGTGGGNNGDGQPLSSTQRPIDLLNPEYEAENNPTYNSGNLIDLDDLYASYSSTHQPQNQQTQAQTKNTRSGLQQITEAASSDTTMNAAILPQKSNEGIDYSHSTFQVKEIGSSGTTNRKRTTREVEDHTQPIHEAHKSNANNAHEDVIGGSSVQSTESPAVALIEDGDESSGVIA